ncbi:MAG: DUF748 domain-containing protein, partial [Pseudomonadota bacterium]|nr:DUF748 domain-containing protein [Pseudomonadota bacterium]
MSVARSRQTSHTTRNLLIGLLVVLVLYALAGFLLLPWWLERTLPDQLEQRMGWQAQIGDIRSNPFTLTVQAEALAASDADGTQVLGFDRLLLDLDFFQLVRGIVGFERIALDEPFIRLDLLEDYSVNFARDWQRANPEPADEPQPETEAGDPPRLYFGGIDVNGGELLFRDFTQAQMAEFRITPLDLTLSDLATWRREGEESDYSLQAALGSQSIEWQGDLSVSPLYSTGSLRISSVDYQTLAHFLAPWLPYDLRGGSVSLSSDYAIQAGEVFRLETSNGELTLDNLAIALSPDAEETRLSNGALKLDRMEFDLNAREFRVGQIALKDLDLAVARGADGQIDWLAPFTSEANASGADAGAGDASDGEPFRWSLAGVSLSNARVLWQDNVPEAGAEIELADLSVSTGAVSHQLDEPVTYELKGTLASGGQLSLNGQVTPEPFTLEA